MGYYENSVKDAGFDGPSGSTLMSFDEPMRATPVGEFVNDNKKEPKDFDTNKLLLTMIETADNLAKDLSSMAVFISGIEDDAFASLFHDLGDIKNEAQNSIPQMSLSSKLMRINSVYYQLNLITRAIKERL